MLNPAGGMPSCMPCPLVSIPQYVFMLIHSIHPNGGPVVPSSDGRAKDYCLPGHALRSRVSLCLLFVNVSGEQISGAYAYCGEYIHGYPGRQTSAYINHLALRLGFIGALCSLAAVLQQLIILVNPDYLQYDSFLIFSGMIYNVNEEMSLEA